MSMGVRRASRQLDRWLPLPPSGSRAAATRLLARRVTTPARPVPMRDSTQIEAARKLNGAAAVLSLAVLGDSGLEHYRGLFSNRLMYLPLLSSSLALSASAHGLGDRKPRPTRLRDAIYGLAALTGLIGSGMHVYNIGKRDGGFSWNNLFYGAPIGAPMALLLSGVLGMSAERVRDHGRGREPSLLGLPGGKVLGGIAAAGLLGTIGEVGLLHFRGAYHNPAMYLPVAAPPIAAALLANASLDSSPRPRRLARLWLRITAALGMLGVGFHIFGIHRNMGGWKNWSQNTLAGPPLPAPPSFTGLAIAGLAALELMAIGKKR
jgi:hypothetical protein